jgi:dipeptidyl aminopeptidase/acylaminoacyl peptidase
MVSGGPAPRLGSLVALALALGIACAPPAPLPTTAPPPASPALAVAASAPPPAPEAPVVAIAPAGPPDVVLGPARLLARAHENADPRFAFDGKRVVYRSTRVGPWQAFMTDPKRADEPPVRVATSDRPAAFAVPAEDAVLLGLASDRGAVLARAPLPKKPKPGAPAPLDPPAAAPLGFVAAGEPFVVRGDRPRAFVGVEAAGVKAMEIPLAPAKEPRVAVEDPGPGRVVDVDREGRRALVLGAGAREGALAVVELGRGAPRTIPIAQGVRVTAAAFAGKGLALVATTSVPGPSLLALDLDTSGVRARVGLPGPVAALAVAPKGDVAAIAIEAADRTVVRLVDVPSLADGPSVALPPGRGRLTSFSPDGRRVGLGWSTPSAPPDVFAIAARDGAVERVRDDVRPSLAALPPCASAAASVPFEGRSIALVVHRREGMPRAPVIVLLPGGPLPPAGFGWAPHVRLPTALGVAVVEASEEAAAPGALDAVARWVAAQPFADPARIALVGAGLAEGGARGRAARAAGGFSIVVDVAASTGEPTTEPARPGARWIVARDRATPDAEAIVRSLRGGGARADLGAFELDPALPLPLALVARAALFLDAR